MNIPKDLHICGMCKKIFNHIKLFLEHKSKCFLPQNEETLSPNTEDLSLESGLFSNQTALDLTVLENASFPLVLQFSNEEVVIDNNPLHSVEENSTQDQLDQILTCNKIINEINEEDVANLLVCQLSKEVINKSILPEQNHHTDERTINISNKDQLNSTEFPTVQNEANEEDIEGITDNQKEKNICNVCNFVTVHNRDLVRHMRKHTGERPYTCYICDKKFARQDKLVTHKRIHMGDKRFKCQLCEYATTDSGALRKHIRIHTDERPHKCQMCSYRARHASHMTVHLRTHTGDSPFFCRLETCARSFKTSTDLKRHMKVHQFNNLSPTYSSFDELSEKVACKSSLKVHKLLNKLSDCYVCQDVSRKGGNKRKRSSKMRLGVRARCVKAHECPHCSAAFVRKDSLRSHLRLHPQTNPPPDDSLRLDVEEPEKENDSFRTDLFELSSLSDRTVTRGPVLLYVDNSNCLQDCEIPLDTDSSVHYVVDNSFL